MLGADSKRDPIVGFQNPLFMVKIKREKQINWNEWILARSAYVHYARVNQAGQGGLGRASLLSVQSKVVKTLFYLDYVHAISISLVISQCKLPDSVATNWAEKGQNFLGKIKITILQLYKMIQVFPPFLCSCDGV